MWTHISPPEAFAQACGLVEAVLALLLWRHRALRRGWGLGWLALSMGCAAVVNLAAPWFVTPLLVTQGNALSTSPVLLAVVMALGFASLAGLVAGLRAYGQQPGWRPARVFFTLWIAVPVVVVVLAWAKVPLPGDWTTLLLMGYCAVLAWQGGRREPGIGYPQLASVLFLYPVMLIAMGFTSLEITTIRYLVAAPYTVIGIMLLSVTLNRLRLERERAQDALRDLNADLELRVTERTRQVQERNTELAHSLETLEQTRSELQATLRIWKRRRTGWCSPKNWLPWAGWWPALRTSSTHLWVPR